MRNTGYAGAMRRNSASDALGPTPGEEDTNLEPPAAQVGTEHLRLLRVAELDDAYRLAPPPGPQGHVAHPRGDAARCDEIALTAVGEQVDRRRAPLPARSQGAALPWAKPTWRGPPTHREDARAIDAHSC
jgi:hypothetical protein